MSKKRAYTNEITLVPRPVAAPPGVRAGDAPAPGRLPLPKSYVPAVRRVDRSLVRRVAGSPPSASLRTSLGSVGSLVGFEEEQVTQGSGTWPKGLPVPASGTGAPAVVVPQVDAAFQAREATRETTNGKDRAVATVIRMAPMTGIFAILATGLAFALRLSLGQTLVIFAVIAGVTYYRFNRTDYEYSAAGVERHRIDRATEVAQTKLAYDNQLRRDLARVYLQHLEQLDHD